MLSKKSNQVQLGIKSGAFVQFPPLIKSGNLKNYIYSHRLGCSYKICNGRAPKFVFVSAWLKFLSQAWLRTRRRRRKQKRKELESGFNFVKNITTKTSQHLWMIPSVSLTLRTGRSTVSDNAATVSTTTRPGLLHCPFLSSSSLPFASSFSGSRINAIFNLESEEDTLKLHHLLFIFGVGFQFENWISCCDLSTKPCFSSHFFSRYLEKPQIILYPQDQIYEPNPHHLFFSVGQIPQQKLGQDLINDQIPCLSFQIFYR
ncbi:hypothetical protein Q3G72_028640 [Acer saccharum]|nr:hypothetical protein Q3G72_028640 [Acer saccharum]